jgi:voltage-gated potassium channel
VVTAFVERHHLAWEIGFAVLALVYLTLGILIDEARGPSVVILGAITAVFIVEFAARYYDAVSRRAYLREHWIDLVSAIPLVGGLRGVRVLRLVRVLPQGRVLRAVAREADARSHARQSSWFLVPCLFVLWISASTAYWTFEHGPNPRVHSFGDALYWSFVTATTVGYGDVTPVTSEGRVIAGLVIFLGIGLVGFASARLTSHLLRHDTVHDAVLHERMARMEAQVDELTRLLRGVHGAVVAGAVEHQAGQPAGEEDATEARVGPIVLGE